MIPENLGRVVVHVLMEIGVEDDICLVTICEAWFFMSYVIVGVKKTRDIRRGA